MTATATALIVEQVAIDTLRPDPANPRRIGDAELEALTRSMRTYGLAQPILVRRQDDTVIGGHQRLVGARRLGYESVPVVRLDLSTDEARLLNLALNRISGEWDEELLARLLADLKDSVDLWLSGFGEDEIAALLRPLDARERAERIEDFDLDDALEEARRELGTRPGDIWALGEHRLLCGDATDAADVERLMDGAEADILWTDPPYGVAYQTKLSREEAVARRRRTDGLEVANDALTPERTRELVATALRLAPLRPGGTF
jgi:ParB-like chromosome segregation protein Spo0J